MPRSQRLGQSDRVIRFSIASVPTPMDYAQSGDVNRHGILLGWGVLNGPQATPDPPA